MIIGDEIYDLPEWAQDIVDEFIGDDCDQCWGWTMEEIVKEALSNNEKLKLEAELGVLLPDFMFDGNGRPFQYEDNDIIRRLDQERAQQKEKGTMYTTTERYAVHTDGKEKKSASRRLYSYVAVPDGQFVDTVPMIHVISDTEEKAKKEAVSSLKNLMRQTSTKNVMFRVKLINQSLDLDTEDDLIIT